MQPHTWSTGGVHKNGHIVPMADALEAKTRGEQGQTVAHARHTSGLTKQGPKCRTAAVARVLAARPDDRDKTEGCGRAQARARQVGVCPNCNRQNGKWHKSDARLIWETYHDNIC